MDALRDENDVSRPVDDVIEDAENADDDEGVKHDDDCAGAGRASVAGLRSAIAGT